MVRIPMGKPGTVRFDARTDGKRAWANIGVESTGKRMNLRKQIVIDTGGAPSIWQIGATKLEEAFVKREARVQKATGGQYRGRL